MPPARYRRSMYGRETAASASGIRVVSSHTAGRPSSVSTPFPSATSSKIAWETSSRGPSESVNSSPSAFSSTAPYARVGAQVARHPRHLARGARMVRRELAPLLRLPVAAAPGGEHHRAGLEHVLTAHGAPDVLRVELGGVVLTESRLDPALRLGGVAGRERALGRQRDTRPCALGGHGG